MGLIDQRFALSIDPMMQNETQHRISTSATEEGIAVEVSSLPQRTSCDCFDMGALFVQVYFEKRLTSDVSSDGTQSWPDHAWRDSLCHAALANVVVQVRPGFII